MIFFFSVTRGMEKEMVYHAHIGSVYFFSINKSVCLIVHFCKIRYSFPLKYNCA